MMKKSLLFAFLLVLIVLGACSSRNGNSIFDPDSGRHIDNWLVKHRAAFREDPSRCEECHGADLTGGIAKLGCNNNAAGCHGHDTGWDDPDVHGAIAKAAPRAEGGRGLSSCQLCHGDDFTGTLLSNDRSCFDPGSASSCHDTTTNPDRQPGAPHATQWRSSTNPQRQHTDTDQANADVCANCHTADKQFNQNPQTGVAGCFNGTLCHQDVTGCDLCHGDQNGKYYPPVAVHGTDPNTANGVGAHGHHIESTATLMAKQGSDSQASVNWCNECHTVPAMAGDAGHIDSTYPADVVFANALEADLNGVTPSFTADSGGADTGTGGTCSVYCHGAKLPSSGAAGPNPTPAWGDSSSGCDFCHGTPPSTSGHTGLTAGDLTQCVSCHPDTVNASGGIATPGNHIDGNLQVQADCWDCHGDGASKAYPPVAVHGNNLNTASGVGAHVAHIEATAALLSKEGTQTTTVDKWCNECHAVPSAVGDAGHIDSNYPGDVTFSGGTESTYNSTSPSFTPDASNDPNSGTGGTCSVYCHGANMPNGSNNGTNTSPAWGDSFAGACTTCHGAPPNSTSHGSVTANDWAACMTCHPDTVTSTSPTVDPVKHINGSVEAVVGSCSTCHGDGASQDYPPVGVYGDPNAGNGVGAHVHHIENTSSLLTKEGTGGTVAAWCSECHTVPSDLTHIDNVYPADVNFSGGTESGYNATTASFTAEGDNDPDLGTGGTCSVYCHGANMPNGSNNGSNTTPSWGDAAPTANGGCGFCHGVPPNSTSHGGLTAGDLTQCVSCHPNTVNGSGTITTTANHINGSVEVQADCSACHGDGATKDYPPVGVHGNATAGNGVGAHVTHIENTSGLITKQGSQTALVDKWCNECHAVPTNVGDTGHIDSVYPADISFAGGTESKLNTTTPTYTPPASSNPDSGTAGTCSVYCHGANMPGGTSEGSNMTPAWTDAAPTVNSGCGFCHGFPPSGVAEHSGVTSGCASCHPHVNGADNGFVDASLHINGVVDGGGDCTTCHDTGGTGTTGPNNRDAIVPEFGLAWGHKKAGRGAVTPEDCIVCHLEGDASTGTRSATYHANGNIDLRDPDGAGETPITDNSGGAFTFTKYGVSYASGARTTTLGNTVAEVVTVKFCMACHDSDGATNTTARTTGGTAAMPFGGVALGANYTATNNAIGTEGLIDVTSQFNAANTSRHPVGAPNNRAYPYSTRLAVPYNNIGTGRDSNTQSSSGTRATVNSVVMVCDDCHTNSTTISSRITSRTITAHGNAQSVAGTYFVSGPTLCLTCHIALDSNNYYNNTSTNGGRHGTGSGLGGNSTTRPRTGMNYCNLCHFSNNDNYTATLRPRYAQDVHGFDSIYGTTQGWTAGPANGMRPVAFMRNTQATSGSWPTNRSPRPYSAPGITAGNANCGGSSGSFSFNTGGSGGSCGGENHGNYAPGGAY